jgi:hypothetical protein
MKIYLLWYQLNRHDVATIACATREYECAEKKAIQLEYELGTIESIGKPYRIGITRSLVNKIVLDVSKEDSNWVIYKNGKWFLDHEDLLRCENEFK